MKTKPWPGSDDVVYVSELLLELAREIQNGNIRITPWQQQELYGLAQLAKITILKCLPAPMPQGGEKQCRL